jgi:acyl-CoA thioester hydrolase
MGEPLVHTLRVRYAECDLQGVVFNAHYLAYFDTSMTELWRTALGSYQTALDHGVDMVLAEATVRFMRPGRFDDQLELSVAITHLGNTSFRTRHRARRGDELLAEGELRHVLVERRVGVKTSIPDWLRGALAPWVLTEGDATPASGTASG